MSTNFTIERLSPENFTKFHQLFQTVFGKRFSLSYLRYKYATAYLGEEYQYLGYLALNSEGEAIGYSGHIPYKMSLDGHTFVGAHSCDHMTLPAARGRGVFNQLTQRSEALVKELGIYIIYGFPNQNNHPLLVKYAGWEIIDFMQVFTLPVTTFPLGSLVRRWSPLEDVFQTWLRYHLRSYPANSSVNSNGGNGLMRDEAFFKHKDRPALHLRKFPAGTVWLKVSGGLFIGDVTVANGASLRQLFDELYTFAQRLMVNKIYFMSSSNHRLLPELRSLAAVVKGNGVGIKRLHLPDHLDPTKLVFTLGDYDTF